MLQSAICLTRMYRDGMAVSDVGCSVCSFVNSSSWFLSRISCVLLLAFLGMWSGRSLCVWYAVRLGFPWNVLVVDVWLLLRLFWRQFLDTCPVLWHIKHSLSRRCLFLSSILAIGFVSIAFGSGAFRSSWSSNSRTGFLLLCYEPFESPSLADRFTCVLPVPIVSLDSLPVVGFTRWRSSLTRVVLWCHSCRVTFILPHGLLYRCWIYTVACLWLLILPSSRSCSGFGQVDYVFPSSQAWYWSWTGTPSSRASIPVLESL